MPSACRRIAMLLAAIACLGAVSPVVGVVHAQDAGETQTQSPSEDPATSTTPEQDLEPLTPSPQGSDGEASGSSGSSGSTTTGSGSTSTPGPQSLPNTGVDARLLLLAGAALLIMGAGLRLRTTPERF